MKMYAKFALTLIAVCLLRNTSFAQTYNTAAGFRMGEGLDLTFQQYIVNNWTAEGILHTNIFSPNTGLTLLAEKHHKVLIRNFGVYYGVGGHYFYKKDKHRAEPTQIVQNVYGVSGILGSELSLGRINLAVDVKPEMHLYGDQAHPFEWNPISFSVRYIIDKRERRKMKDWKVWDKVRD